IADPTTASAFSSFSTYTPRVLPSIDRFQEQALAEQALAFMRQAYNRTVAGWSRQRPAIPGSLGAAARQNPPKSVWVESLGRQIEYSDRVLSPENPFTQNFLRFIQQYPERFKGKRVLELGTGTGVLAIALARAGAEVIATDI